jgi:hypothetical protein
MVTKPVTALNHQVKVKKKTPTGVAFHSQWTSLSKNRIDGGN